MQVLPKSHAPPARYQLVILPSYGEVTFLNTFDHYYTVAEIGIIMTAAVGDGEQ
jgi:hypothetical protein